MKIFLAGTYSEQRNSKDVMKSLYNLESFFYIKPWQTELIHSSKMFLLDSGAFTFCGTKNYNGKNFDEYLERYADFIKRNDVLYFFELDVDSVIGYEKVIEYRKRLEKLTGRQPIPVWHIARGKKEFIRHCEEYPYVALGGYVAAIKASDPRQKAYINAYPWFIKTAHEHGAQIHGLGYTSVKGLKKHHFDSVDSTRWNCARFGRLEYFDGETIRPVDRRKEGKKLVGGKNADIMRITLEEWVKFQKYAETHL